MTIEEIFKHNIRTLYTVDGVDEMNEAIYTLYSIISAAIRQRADYLVLTKSEISWEREGKKLGGYQVVLEPDRGYDGELDFMLTRDTVLNDYVEKVTSSTTESLRYKLSERKDLLLE